MRSKILKITIFILLLISSLNAKYIDILDEVQKLKYKECKTSIYGMFRSYQRAYKEELRTYKRLIRQYWPTIEVSTDHKWVEYDRRFLTKKVINFERRYMMFSVAADNPKDARDKLLKLLDDTVNTTVKSAVENDILEYMVFKKLKKDKPTSNTQTKLIADALTMWDIEKYRGYIEGRRLLVRKYKNRNLYTIKLDLPSKYVIRKAETYKKLISTQSRKFKIPEELIFAIIHYESSFNPMGRSHALAYGMMQTNPKDACFDAYKFLHDEHKLLTSFYLYNPSNNIEIGTAYLHVLYYQYLKYIKDRRSRLYCTIAAYDAGPLEVLKVFSESTDFEKAGKAVNAMDHTDAYQKLKNNLPKFSTRIYLRNVVNATAYYRKLIRQINLR